MDEKLKELCIEISDVLREKFDSEATIIIKGDRTYRAECSGLLLKPDESLCDVLKYH